jgi:hypothetical protein
MSFRTHENAYELRNSGLVSKLNGSQLGKRTALGWQALPQAFLLTIGYSEALFITLAALALLLIVEERWVFGGVVAGLSSLVRPTGVVFVVVGGVALWQTYKSRRSLAPLAVIAFAPLGPWPTSSTFGYTPTVSTPGRLWSVKAGELTKTSGSHQSSLPGRAYCFQLLIHGSTW